MNCHNEHYYEGAEFYYKKAIAINPQYSSAYLGLLGLLVEKSVKITAQMNGLESSVSVADKKAFGELKIQKGKIIKSVFPYLQKVVSIDSFNSSVEQLLKCINIANVKNSSNALASRE